MDCWFNLLAYSAFGLMDQSLVSVDHKSTVLEKNLIYLTYLLWLLFSQSNIPLISISF